MNKMDNSRKIRFAIYPFIIAAIIVALGPGAHGNILFTAFVSVISAIVLFTAFEQLVTLISSLRDRGKFKEYRISWISMAGSPAILMKPVILIYLQWRASRMTAVSEIEQYAALAGSVIAAAGAVFSILTMKAWATMFVGHGIQQNQKLVVVGIYSRVRNPIYLADILYWIGLSVGTLSAIAGALTVVYVIPFYFLYIKSEEKMMLEHFKDDYVDYLKNVPRLIPSFSAYKPNAS